MNRLRSDCMNCLVKKAADVILSKGQGNFETLRKCGKNIYYLFLCKCDMFARQFGVDKFAAILMHDSCYHENV